MSIGAYATVQNTRADDAPAIRCRVLNNQLYRDAAPPIINILRSLNLPVETTYAANKVFTNVFWDPASLNYVCLESKIVDPKCIVTETKVSFENSNGNIKTFNVNVIANLMYKRCEKCAHFFKLKAYNSMQCYEHPHTVYNKCTSCLRKVKNQTYEKHICLILKGHEPVPKKKKCYKLKYPCEKCNMLFKYKCELGTHICGKKYTCKNCSHEFKSLFLLKKHIYRTKCRNAPVLINVNIENTSVLPGVKIKEEIKT